MVVIVPADPSSLIPTLDVVVGGAEVIVVCS